MTNEEYEPRKPHTCREIDRAEEMEDSSNFTPSWKEPEEERGPQSITGDEQDDPSEPASVWMVIYWEVLRYFRSKVRPGHKRLEWQCVGMTA